MKKLKVLSAWVCAAAFCASIVPVAAYAAQPAETSTSIKMYRLYNPNSGEHFYTSSESERKNVLAAGWNDEGIGWYAPKEGQDVYRLYNKNAGEHHYTLDVKEKNNLVRVGWTYEGVGWKSAPAKDGAPIYRQYNPNAFANNHNYTTSSSEKNHLISLGWKDEKIGWYGVRKGHWEKQCIAPARKDCDIIGYKKTYIANDDGLPYDTPEECPGGVVGYGNDPIYGEWYEVPAKYKDVWVWDE